jgi:hypothetical protein
VRIAVTCSQVHPLGLHGLDSRAATVLPGRVRRPHGTTADIAAGYRVPVGLAAPGPGTLVGIFANRDRRYPVTVEGGCSQVVVSPGQAVVLTIPHGHQVTAFQASPEGVPSQPPELAGPAQAAPQLDFEIGVLT